MTNFTVAPGPNPPTMGAVTGTSTITFTVTGIPKNENRDFYVGADFGIGDNTAGATGAATAIYSASVPGSSLNSTALATVFRPISVAENISLAFGAIFRPSAGNGTVTVNASDNQRIVTGTGAVGVGVPAHNRGDFTISGEGGQAVSISVPSSFDMTGPGPPITVTTNNVGAGAQILSSALGSAGTFTLYVGGSFPFSSTTQGGDYSGTYDVTVQYN